MKNKVFIVILTVLILVSCGGKSELVVITGNTMGTTYSIKIVDNKKEITPAEIKKEVEVVLKEVNRQMSTWQKDSEITLFNNSDSTDWVNVSKDFAFVVNEALEISKLSEGYFDITVMPLVNAWGFGPTKELIEPTKEKLDEIREFVGFEKIDVRLNPAQIKKSNPNTSIDLSAIAKGFGVDKVFDLLEKLGFENFFVEIGGEVRAKGKNIKNHYWRIGIASPDIDGTLTNVLTLNNLAVATSGDYRNYRELNGKRISHTINPKTEKPVSHNLASVTVVAKTCYEADALATAFNTMGKDMAMGIAEENSIPVFFIYRENEEFKVLTNKLFDSLITSD